MLVFLYQEMLHLQHKYQLSEYSPLQYFHVAHEFLPGDISIAHVVTMATPLQAMPFRMQQQPSGLGDIFSNFISPCDCFNVRTCISGGKE